MPVAKWTHRLILCFLLGSLCACVEIDEHIVIQADGSGMVHLETRTETTADEMEAMLGMENYLPDMLKHYPPLTDKSLSALFPGAGFSIEIPDAEAQKEKRILKARIRFKHIDDLLRSPYGQLKSLEATLSDGTMTVKSRSGLDVLSVCRHLSDLDQENFYSGNLNMLCEKGRQAKHQFKLTLPNAVRSDTGSTSKQTASWTMEMTASGAAPKNRIAFDTVMSASCDATGLEFKAAAPVRLDLHSFAEVLEETAAIAGTPQEARAYQDAVTFAPLEMSTIRTFAIAEKGDYRNRSRLIGLISLPSELKPGLWGRTRLLEAVDGLGTNLLAKADFDTSCMESHGLRSIEEKIEIPEKGDRVFHPVCLEFLPPRISARSIARLSGIAEIVHYRTQSTVKIENAIDQQQIVPQRQLYTPGNYRPPEEKRLQNQALAASAMDLVVERAVDMDFALTIQLMVKSIKAQLNDMAFYDKDGNPIPGCFTHQATGDGQGGHRFTVVVYGRPKPPFSLALSLRGGGTELSVPFAITNLSIHGTKSDGN